MIHQSDNRNEGCKIESRRQWWFVQTPRSTIGGFQHSMIFLSQILVWVWYHQSLWNFICINCNRTSDKSWIIAMVAVWQQTKFSIQCREFQTKTKGFAILSYRPFIAWFGRVASCSKRQCLWYFLCGDSEIGARLVFLWWRVPTPPPVLTPFFFVLSCLPCCVCLVVVLRSDTLIDWLLDLLLFCRRFNQINPISNQI